MTSSGCSMTLKCPENVSSTSRAFVIARFITIILYAGVRPSQTPAISKVGWLIWWRRWPVEWASKSWNPRKNAFMLLELEQMPPKYCCQARSMYSLPYNFCKALLPKSTVSIRNMMPKKGSEYLRIISRISSCPLAKSHWITLLMTLPTYGSLRIGWNAVCSAWPYVPFNRTMDPTFSG